MEIGDIARRADAREKLLLSLLNVKADFPTQQCGEKTIIRAGIKEGKSMDFLLPLRKPNGKHGCGG